MFRLGEAAAFGVTQDQLEGPGYRRLHRGIYAWHGLEVTPSLQIKAASLLLPPDGAVSGRAAAFLYGVQLWRPPAPVELTVPRNSKLRCRQGVTVSRTPMADTDITLIAGVRSTTPLRTAFDLARREPRIEAVACLDAMLHKHLVTTARLRAYVAEHQGWRGTKQALEVIRLGNPRAESPMESQLRIILVDAGLPAPVVNEPVHDAGGRFLARPDLRIRNVLIEFDGDVHRGRQVFVRDLRRQNRVVKAGFVVLRFSGSDVLHRPALIVEQVRSALALR